MVKSALPGASIGSAARRALSFGAPPAAAARNDTAASDATQAAAEGALRFGSSAVLAAAAADYVSAPSLREKARSGALPVSIGALEVRCTARPSSWKTSHVGVVYCTTVGTKAKRDGRSVCESGQQTQNSLGNACCVSQCMDSRWTAAGSERKAAPGSLAFDACAAFPVRQPLQQSKPKAD